MEHRQLGRSGFKVPALSFGTATFGGSSEFFARWGTTDVAQASALVDICLEAGANFFDTSNIYSNGASEEILGEALKGRRDQALISTKASFTTGPGANDKGASRWHLIRACEDSLRRLQTDHIDLYFMHGYDALTPADEVLRALDDLITAGKIRYIGASNFSGWHLMKALATSEARGLARYVAYQGYYSLANRDYEWELMPLALDQGVGTMVWSPLGWGRLTGKIRRGQPIAEGRISKGGHVGGPEVDQEHLYNIVDVLDEIAKEHDRSIPQIALAWVLSRPSVANVVVGARTESQLRANLQATEITLSADQIARLDAVSRQRPIYPYWHQMDFDERNPKPTNW